MIVAGGQDFIKLFLGNILLVLASPNLCSEIERLLLFYIISKDNLGLLFK